MESETDKEQADLNYDYTISEVMGITDFDIQYIDYKVVAVYPEDTQDEYFSIYPDEGNELLVVSFEIKNMTDGDQLFDMHNMDVGYQLDINVGKIYKPLLTLLDNDLQFVNNTVKGQEKKNTVLVFEVPKK